VEWGKEMKMKTLRRLFKRDKDGDRFVIKVQSDRVADSVLESKPIEIEKTTSSFRCRCIVCDTDVISPFKCEYCGGSFCLEHRLPEVHLCVGLPLRSMESLASRSMKQVEFEERQELCEICRKEGELVLVYIRLDEGRNYFSPDPFPGSIGKKLCKACRLRLVGRFDGFIGLS